MQFVKTILFSAAVLSTGLLSAQTTQRTPFYESFTSSTCGPCRPGNEYLESLFSNDVNEGKFTSLKYQMNWPGSGDPYYTAEGGSRRGFYSISSVPRLEVDGGYDASPGGVDQADMDAWYATDAVFEIEASFQVNETTKKVDIQIKTTSLTELSSSGGLFLHCAIFEKETTGNVKSNGETKFEHVMKKMVPSAGGTYMGAQDVDEVTNFELSYTFKGSYILPPNAGSPVNHATNHTVEQFSDLGVVVWIQRSSTREVYQSTYAVDGMLGLSENTDKNSHELSIYPNPTTDLTKISFSEMDNNEEATITIVDYTGKLVYEKTVNNQNTIANTIEVDTKDFESGMYFVVLNTKEGRKTKKLSVIH